MVLSIVRFNQAQPGLDPTEMASRYQASIDMAAHADAHGIQIVSLEEHHGAEDGWSPSPLITAGLVFGRCPSIHVSVSALLLPLHDPLRVAEDIAVLDLASGGRLSVVLGLGYRPEEYAAHGKDWDGRGALMDEAVAAVLAAWTGEPFEHHGVTVRVTPVPVSRPARMILIGGTAKASARRAVRFGLPFHPAADLPQLADYYRALCAEAGVRAMCIMPSSDTSMVHVAVDPDKAWAEVGPCFLHEALTYHGWQRPQNRSAVHSHATTVEELRAERIYQVLTPAECVARAEERGAAATFALHPLVGGMPIEAGWESLRLFTDEVLPALAR